MTTLEEHNERLVLEKQMLRQRLAELEGQAGRVIVALMGSKKTKKITPKQWEDARDHNVSWAPDDDGGVVVTVEKRSDADDDS